MPGRISSLSNVGIGLECSISSLFNDRVGRASPDLSRILASRDPINRDLAYAQLARPIALVRLSKLSLSLTGKYEVYRLGFSRH